MVYAIPLSGGFCGYSIVRLEILNLVVALKIWGHYWKDKTIEINCDNMAVLEVIWSRKARDAMLAKCATNIWF